MVRWIERLAEVVGQNQEVSKLDHTVSIKVTLGVGIGSHYAFATQLQLLLSDLLLPLLSLLLSIYDCLLLLFLFAKQRLPNSNE